MSPTHIFLDAGFKNELSYMFCFNQEAEYIKNYIDNRIGGSEIDYMTMDDVYSTLKILRIIACDDTTFLILKTMIELDENYYLYNRASKGKI